MKFKSNLFCEYTFLKDIEIPINKKDVIERLQLQSVCVRNQIHNERPMGVECRNNGTVFAGDYSFKHNAVIPYRRTYAIHGKLEEDESNKTILKLYGYRIKGRSITLAISALLFFIYIIFLLIAILAEGSFEPKYLILIPLIILSEVATLFYEHREMTEWEEDRKILLSEIENRVNGVIRWDD